MASYPRPPAFSVAHGGKQVKLEQEQLEIQNKAIQAFAAVSHKVQMYLADVEKELGAAASNELKEDASELKALLSGIQMLWQPSESQQL